MRLGGYFSVERAQELEPLCEKLDTHGLSAISAPGRLAAIIYPGVSRTWRTLDARTVGVYGFCKKATSGSRTP